MNIDMQLPTPLLLVNLTGIAEKDVAEMLLPAASIGMKHQWCSNGQERDVAVQVVSDDAVRLQEQAEVFWEAGIPARVCTTPRDELGMVTGILNLVTH
jgi:hypothetical protein